MLHIFTTYNKTPEELNKYFVFAFLAKWSLPRIIYSHVVKQGETFDAFI